MSRQPKSLWNESNSKQLAKAVRNFNAKVRRLEKKLDQMPIEEARKIILPEKVGLKELRNVIQTRKDLDREVKALQRFTQRTTRKGVHTRPDDFVDVPDNEYNLKITRWQRTEMNRDAANITRKRKKRAEEIEAFEQTSRGQGLGYNVQMGQADTLMLRPRKAFTPSMGRRDIQGRAKSLRKERQRNYFTDADQRCKDNYIAAIERYYGHMPGVDKLIDRIKRMHRDTFFKRFKEEGATFEIASPPRGAIVDMDAYYDGLVSTWLPEKRKEG